MEHTRWGLATEVCLSQKAEGLPSLPLLALSTKIKSGSFPEQSQRHPYRPCLGYLGMRTLLDCSPALR